MSKIKDADLIKAIQIVGEENTRKLIQSASKKYFKKGEKEALLKLEKDAEKK